MDHLILNNEHGKAKSAELKNHFMYSPLSLPCALMKLDMPETDKYFHLEERIEVGMMAEIFLGWIGQKIFYIILCVSAPS